ncbi:MAG TPA: hypothetical protein VMF32_15955 [Xanthobacteraceae bacterium]|nr:hypothetical protein [Xanthobacteraceae bacterium]
MSELGTVCTIMGDIAKASGAWRATYDRLYPKGLFPSPLTVGQVTARLIATDEALRDEIVGRSVRAAMKRGIEAARKGDGAE